MQHSSISTIKSEFDTFILMKSGATFALSSIATKYKNIKTFSDHTTACKALQILAKYDPAKSDVLPLNYYKNVLIQNKIAIQKMQLKKSDY